MSTTLPARSYAGAQLQALCRSHSKAALQSACVGFVCLLRVSRARAPRSARGRRTAGALHRREVAAPRSANARGGGLNRPSRNGRSSAGELRRALFEEGATRLLPVLAREGPVDVGHLETELV